AARSDHRHAHGIAHGTGQFEVETDLRAVTVHAREQNLARAMLCHLPGPGHGVQARVLAPAVGVDIPAVAACDLVVALAPLGVDRDNDGLRAELARSVAMTCG